MSLIVLWKSWLHAVRYVQVDPIKTQLEMGNVVLLSNLAYGAAGEILCCNIYDVATHAAIELGAEKLICMTQQVQQLLLSSALRSSRLSTPRCRPYMDGHTLHLFVRKKSPNVRLRLFLAVMQSSAKSKAFSVLHLPIINVDCRTVRRSLDGPNLCGPPLDFLRKITVLPDSRAENRVVSCP